MTKAADIARIVVCEDSATYSRGLQEFLERDADLRVVAVCETAEDLLRSLPGARADLVTMDLELPGMDGVQATQRIMGTDPLPILVLSAHSARGSERAVAALSAGALDAIPKSEIRLADSDSIAAVALRRRVKRLARTRLRLPAGRPEPPRQDTAKLRGRAVAVAGICSSTGGPQALQAVLGELPSDFPLPLLVVQHMSAGFTDGLITWLSRSLSPPVRLAGDGERLQPGVTFAREGVHLRLDGSRRLVLDAAAAADGYLRPSGDVLLRSLAESAGADAAGIVLTGLGRDGAEGLAAMRAAGGVTIAQDENSSVVYGMPHAALQRGAEFVLGLGEIGAALTELAGIGAAR